MNKYVFLKGVCVFVLVYLVLQLVIKMIKFSDSCVILSTLCYNFISKMRNENHIYIYTGCSG